MARRIKLMADYQCHPLWDYVDPNDVPECRDPAELPLTAETVAALKVWASWFDSRELPVSREVSPEEVESFNRTGRQLWKALQQELGPDWHVVYHESGRLFEPEG